MKKPRNQKRASPYFKSGEAQRKQSNFQVTSHRTGLAHSFENVAGWEKIIENMEAKRAVEHQDILSALAFYNWLRDKTIDTSRLSTRFKGPGFRYANPIYGPITIVGSVGDGGRFNPGSAQMHEQFPYVTKFGSVYLASSRECAEAEAAKPLGCLKMYEVVPSRELLLWDMKSVIDDLDYINLMENVRQSYGDRLWCLQKSPVISQILSLKLKLTGGEGIYFESTKVDGHQNVALFFATDDDAKAALQFKEI